MQNFIPHSEFTDVTAEREVIAAIAANPELYPEVHSLLLADAIYVEAEAWHNVTTAITLKKPPLKFDGWPTTTDLRSSAQRLNELLQRRVVASALEAIAQKLYTPEKPARTLLTELRQLLDRVPGTPQVT